MTPSGTGGTKKTAKSSPSLSEQAHQQRMDLLRVAEESQYDEIRKVALELATKTSDAAIELEKENSKYRRKQEARVPPVLILWINLALAVAVTLWCVYAYLHYPEAQASRLSWISVRLYVLFAAISLLLSGHLSQANFIKMFNWFKDGLKNIFGGGQR